MRASHLISVITDGWNGIKKKEWYIEEYDGEWIILPEEYDRSRLWHVE